MSQATVESIGKNVAPESPPRPIKSAGTIVDATTEALTRGGAAAETIVKENTATMAESSSAAGSAFKELATAYQEIATRNARTLTAAMQSLSSVKSISEFISLEQRLIQEGVEAAVSDTRTISRLTAAVFTATMDPVKHRFEAAIR